MKEPGYFHLAVCNAAVNNSIAPVSYNKRNSWRYTDSSMALIFVRQSSSRRTCERQSKMKGRNANTPGVIKRDVATGFLSSGVYVYWGNIVDIFISTTRVI